MPKQKAGHTICQGLLLERLTLSKLRIQRITQARTMRLMTPVNSYYVSIMGQDRSGPPPHTGNGVNNLEDTKVQRRSRSVTFDLSPCTVTDSCPIYRLTTSEIEGLWMQTQDYERIRQEGLVLLSLMATKRSTAVECFRGLESCTKSGAIHRRCIRNAAMDAVLLEQELQRERGVTDPERISRVYREYSRGCKENASLRGLHDEKQAVQGEKEMHRRPRKSTFPSVDRPPVQVIRFRAY